MSKEPVNPEGVLDMLPNKEQLEFINERLDALEIQRISLITMLTDNQNALKQMCLRKTELEDRIKTDPDEPREKHEMEDK